MTSRPTLEDMQRQFLKANYAPDADCQRCGGEGVVGPRRVIMIGEKSDGTMGSWIDERPEEGGQPCICVFVGDPAIRDIVQDGLKRLAAEHRAATQAG